MQPKIHMFNGEPFVATPYRAGTFIRSDVFWRQFSISCQGRIEYLEDDPIYGTWWSPETLTIGEHGLIEAAMELATRCVVDRAFDLDDIEDALSFSPEIVLIHDTMNRLVLAGEPRGLGIRWCKPVASEQDVSDLNEQIHELHREAHREAGWDNHCTAKRLSLQAQVLAGRFVDPFWRPHARRAIQSVSEVQANAVH
ncbi:hypothetical protein [Achromobacter anxifer]|uniref:hypothetical protein n=1 Tax=Achromobacter anxifer TaxID=1287737 RepID=UPI0023FA3F88|nr:hypothetical protein [Achromobacter anxifer]MDF8361303.1 hypothetical protein [Achromobacter anxifer]